MKEFFLSRKFKTGIVFAIPVLLALLYIFRGNIMGLSKYLGVCVFHEVTGWHCPGCGNTRSLRALLNLHPLIAIHNNPAMPTLALIGVCAYIELVSDVIGKKIKILPRSIIFWYSVLGLFFIFYILRNIFPVLAPIPDP